ITPCAPSIDLSIRPGPLKLPARTARPLRSRSEGHRIGGRSTRCYLRSQLSVKLAAWTNVGLGAEWEPWHRRYVTARHPTETGTVAWEAAFEALPDAVLVFDR